MFTRHVFIACMVFYHYFEFTTARWIACYPLDSRYPLTFWPPRADCLAALNMIPDGSLRPGPPVGNKPGFLLPDSVRDPKRFSIPAIFWSGRCEIEIRCDKFPPMVQRADFAWDLYSTVWPEMRSLARTVIDKCVVNGSGSGRVTFAAVKHLERVTCSVVVHAHMPVPLDPVEDHHESHLRHYQTDPSGRTVEVVGF